MLDAVDERGRDHQQDQHERSRDRQLLPLAADDVGQDPGGLEMPQQLEDPQEAEQPQHPEIDAEEGQVKWQNRRQIDEIEKASGKAQAAGDGPGVRRVRRAGP